MPVVDLRLASSYVPAIVCAGKSVVVAVLAVVFVPLGGIPALALLLILDRMYCGERIPPVFDVNAVLAFAFGLCVVVEERHHRGTPTQLAIPLLGVWTAISVFQSWRIVIPGRWEVLLLSALAALVSLTHQAEEALPLLVGRVLVFVVVVVSTVYASSAVAGEGPSDALVFLFLMRTGPILLAPALSAAIIAGMLLALVVGGVYYHHERSAVDLGSSQKQAAAKLSPSSGGSSQSVDALTAELGEDEEQQLREALARHKGSRAR